MAEELEKLKHGNALKNISLGGYGEMAINDFSKRNQRGGIGGKADTADLVRVVLHFGYRYNDWIEFYSAFEFEHGTTSQGRGSVSVEQAYLDFRLHDNLDLRAGLALVPIGFLNDLHEPTAFHGVTRPSVETNIIPTTWRENSLGLIGRLGPLTFTTYAMTGLQAMTDAGVTGFSGAAGLRNGRTSGAMTRAEDLAWVSRIDFRPAPGFRTGASYYVGEADQGLSVNAVSVSLWEVHGEAEYRGLELRGLYSEIRIGNADTVNAFQAFTSAAMTSVGSRLFGGYGQAAFDLLSLCPETDHYLAPFFRYERYDTQADTPDSFAKNPANSRVEYTAGVTYRPIPRVVGKFDYQWIFDQARTGVNQMNLGLGYTF